MLRFNVTCQRIIEIKREDIKRSWYLRRVDQSYLSSSYGIVTPMSNSRIGKITATKWALKITFLWVCLGRHIFSIRISGRNTKREDDLILLISALVVLRQNHDYMIHNVFFTYHWKHVDRARKQIFSDTHIQVMLYSMSFAYDVEIKVASRKLTKY